MSTMKKTKALVDREDQQRREDSERYLQLSLASPSTEELPNLANRIG